MLDNVIVPLSVNKCQSLDTKADLHYPIDTVSGCVAALRKHRNERNPSCKLILSVGGGSGSGQYPAVAASVTHTKRFCETAKQLVDQYEFDGLDSKTAAPKYYSR